MNTLKVITEAFCETCNELWSTNSANPARDAREHAEATGHRVRVTRVVVTTYNLENGKRKVTDDNNPSLENHRQN